MAKAQGKSLSILIAWPNLVPTNHAGAVRGAALIDAAQGLGWKAIVVTPRLGDDRGSSTSDPRIKLATLYDSYAARFPVPAPFFALPRTILRLISTARRGRAQMAISSTPGIFLALEACVASSFLGIPFVLDVRDSWAQEELFHAGLFRNWIKKRLEGVICRRASQVWTVTESLSKELVELHRLRPDRVKVVPNGADLSIFRVDKKPREFDLVFLGVPSLYRDLPVLIEAFQALSSRRPTVRILWLGWREHDLPHETRMQLEALAERGILRLSPPVDHAMVPEVLSRCGIGVVSLSGQPVFRTAVGAKVYEYLAGGLPLLCLGPHGASELRKLVESSDVGFYATSVGEFVERSIEMLREPGLLSRFSQNCLTTASNYDRGTVFRTALGGLTIALD